MIESSQLAPLGDDKVASDRESPTLNRELSCVPRLVWLTTAQPASSLRLPSLPSKLTMRSSARRNDKIQDLALSKLHTAPVMTMHEV